MSELAVVVAREKEWHDRQFDKHKDIDEAALKTILTHQTPDHHFTAISPRMKRAILGTLKDIKGRKVLVYGCGTDGGAVWFARQGAHVTAIDISSVAVERQRLVFEKLNMKDVEVREADAHDTKLEAESFDLIYGNAIIHHLDVDRCLAEIRRLLKPDGRAVFRDVLHGNILLRFFRSATPEERTEDEHPLKPTDIKAFGEVFGNVKFDAYLLTGQLFHLGRRLANRVFSKLRLPIRIPKVALLYSIFDSIDGLLFKLLPPLRHQAWLCLIVIRKPG